MRLKPPHRVMELPPKENGREDNGDGGRREYDGSLTDRLEGEIIRSAIADARRGKIWRLWTVWTARKIWRCITDRRTRERREQKILCGCILVLVADILGVPVQTLVQHIIAILAAGMQ